MSKMDDKVLDDAIVLFFTGVASNKSNRLPFNDPFKSGSRVAARVVQVLEGVCCLKMCGDV